MAKSANRSRQTVSFLTKRFREVGLEPDARHGQNFLVDLNLIDLLVRSAQLESSDLVLEVGTGTGSLTGRMAELAGFVISAEIDAHLHQLAMEELEGFDNVELRLGDALKNKNNFTPELKARVGQLLDSGQFEHFKLAANLPYNIATPVISNLLRWDRPPDSMTVTIQKELAERVVASPSTKDYGSLSVWVQSQCNAEIVRIMPPSVFWPRPKVHSAILHIELVPEKRARMKDLEFFHQFVRSLFFHRRKFLRSVLISAFKGKLGKPDVDQVMGDAELGENARAEQLSVEQIIDLNHRFLARLNES